VEERVNDDNIGIQTINSRRENEVKAGSVDPAIPRAAEGIQEKPGEKFQKMGTGEGRNFMPEDGSGVLRASGAWLIQREALNALGIKMDLAMLFAGQAFQEFGESTLRAMTAIHEG
jgi:hypothetical protein